MKSFKMCNKGFSSKCNMRLTSSVSDQNVYFTYVCLVNGVKPIGSSNNEDVHSVGRNSSRRLFHVIDAETENDKRADGSPDGKRNHRMGTKDVNSDHDQPIQVERSRAVHELVESHRHEDSSKVHPSSSHDAGTITKETADSDCDNIECNPNILKLTKMKWLTEDQDGSPDSSSPSISPSNSLSSTCSRESNEGLGTCVSSSDRCLSTILRLDREHNMFGLSNIAIEKTSRRIRKEDSRPVFPQTAIIQICCGKGCCKHMSKTDLPVSLKCGGCRNCCIDPGCSVCAGPSPCEPQPCPNLCSSCSRGKCTCRNSCPPSKCLIDHSNSYGMKISYKHKLKYEPSPIELTPRSSCTLQKPLAARSCHHIPLCVPPSSCFPYLMPCYWPARAGAPCNDPARCFHNPPCRAPRRPKYPSSCISSSDKCPTAGKCSGNKSKEPCGNPVCPGNIPVMREAIQSRFGSK